MSKRWLYILLIISLAFNLAVLGSFVFIRFFMPSPAGPPHLRGMGGRGPGSERMQMWQQHCGNDDEMIRIKSDFAESKQALMQELAKDPINEPKIKTILDSSLVIHSSLERRLGQRLLTLRKTMSAEEARDFFGKSAAGERPPFDRGMNQHPARNFNRQNQQYKHRRTQ
ncbi:MAG: hypothetical protein CVU48_00600 [Candidatus Cloacimonetes bacterium HGW-Cloacimonetes-1]|jgi:uncharacterized membrane protein|nr:MAG: hypothetical protein CVU48_00600 [Candidatus Cloacimonetes bacterium HGW-Cloacimonetes-1]